MIANPCTLLAGWKNHYGGRDNHVYDAKNRIALTTTGTKDVKNNI